MAHDAFSKPPTPPLPSPPLPFTSFLSLPAPPVRTKRNSSIFFSFFFPAETSPKSAPRRHVPRSRSSRLLKTQLTGERNFARKRNNKFQNGSDFEEFQIARSEREKEKKTQ